MGELRRYLSVQLGQWWARHYLLRLHHCRHWLLLGRLLSG